MPVLIHILHSQGAPDLSVLVGEKPHILLLSEVRIDCTSIYHPPISPWLSFLYQLKKNLSKRKKMAVLGWRAEQTATDSQIGQLLYYMLGVQLQRLQLFLSPMQRAANYTPPSPLLGIFIEEGKVYIYIYTCTHNVLSGKTPLYAVGSIFWHIHLTKIYYLISGKGQLGKSLSHV